MRHSTRVRASFVRFVALLFCMVSFVFCMGSKSGFDFAPILSLQSHHGNLEGRRVYFSHFAGGGQIECINPLFAPIKMLRYIRVIPSMRETRDRYRCIINLTTLTN